MYKNFTLYMLIFLKKISRIPNLGQERFKHNIIFILFSMSVIMASLVFENITQASLFKLIKLKNIALIKSVISDKTMIIKLFENPYVDSTQSK